MEPQPVNTPLETLGGVVKKICGQFGKDRTDAYEPSRLFIESWNGVEYVAELFADGSWDMEVTDLGILGVEADGTIYSPTGPRLQAHVNAMSCRFISFLEWYEARNTPVDPDAPNNWDSIRPGVTEELGELIEHLQSDDPIKICDAVERLSKKIFGGDTEQKTISLEGMRLFEVVKRYLLLAYASEAWCGHDHIEKEALAVHEIRQIFHCAQDSGVRALLEELPELSPDEQSSALDLLSGVAAYSARPELHSFTFQPETREAIELTLARLEVPEEHPALQMSVDHLRRGITNVLSGKQFFFGIH